MTATSADTWPISSGVRLSWALWSQHDGTPVTAGTLVLTMKDAAGTTVGSWTGNHSSGGAWAMDVPAVALTEGAEYEVKIVATPSGGEPETYRSMVIATYNAPRYRVL